MRNWMKASLAVFFALLVSCSAVSSTYAERVPIGLIYSRTQCASLREGKDPLLQYRQALELAGGSVVVLSPDYDRQFLELQMKQIGGLLLPGGIDVDPRFHNEKRHEKLRQVDTEFDKFEFSMLKYATEKDIPILGICRGAQLMAVYYGGSLYQDIPSQIGKESENLHQVSDGKGNRPTWHPAVIEQDSMLFSLIRRASLIINSSHHQAVKKVPPGFKVTCRANDGVVECIESENGRFIMGVQFHPERMRMEDPTFDALFVRLVKEGRKSMKAGTQAAPISNEN